MCFLKFLRRNALLSLLLTLLLSACGGGGGGSGGSVVSGAPIQGNNVMPVAINAGLSNIANRMYASVTLCAPGTTHCITLDNILVDTGSAGLRLMASTDLTGLGLAPPSGFSSLQNCVHFLDNSSAWGSVKVADVHLGNMVASSLPIQLINDPGVTAASPCSGTALTSAKSSVSNDHHALNANGILGIGIYTEDCGSSCASNSSNTSYYTCNSINCTSTAVATTLQIQNPIPHFPSDNNGVVVVLPAVGTAGVTQVNGSLLFGVGTQTNNQLGNSTLLQTSIFNSFNITTSLTSATPSGVATITNLTTMPGSFLDTGSNGLYFGTAVMQTCTISSFFYCPPSASPVTISATLRGNNGVNKSFSFVAANAEDQFNSPNFALPALTGVGSNNTDFDWGLPFYYGRTVFLGIEGQRASTGVGNATVTGPFYAF